MTRGMFNSVVKTMYVIEEVGWDFGGEEIGANIRSSPSTEKLSFLALWSLPPFVRDGEHNDECGERVLLVESRTTSP